MVYTDLRRANLSGANLFKAELSRADLSGANLSGADLLLADLHGAVLRGADLSGANLRKASLSGADLSGAHLRGADLGGAKIFRANLRETDFSGARLNIANLTGANIFGANLREADLRRANLSGANLSRANLSRAILKETIFSDVNLTKVEGLNTCRHGGPSTLDSRTLQQSGPLSLSFLRGCGLPDLLIDYLPSLFNQPIQFYSCFISYSTKDEDFARRLHADLQDKGVRCWFAPKDARQGRKLHEQIGEAIQLYEKLLLVLSEHSINSEWVKTEIAKAREREVREKRQVLFPISVVDYETIKQWECFDADIGKDSAREIREYFILPDFSNWKSHDDYQKAFYRLLRDLKPALERKPES
jgi:uncharacterized protein YjbI with pentapeptide repeats